MAAAWSVQAASSSTLRAEICGEQRADDGQRGHPGQREQEERRPPRRTGDDPQRTGGEEGADRLPGALPEQGADLVGVVVDPVEHLADGLLGQRRERLVQGGVEQVGAQPALGPVDGSGPQRAADGVEQRRTDDAQRRAARPAGSTWRARRAGRRSASPGRCRRQRWRRPRAPTPATGPRSRRQSTVWSWSWPAAVACAGRSSWVVDTDQTLRRGTDSRRTDFQGLEDHPLAVLDASRFSTDRRTRRSLKPAGMAAR